MTLFDHNLIVSYIRIAIFVPLGSAQRTHTDRRWHGFAYNVNSSTTYTFDSGKVLTCQPGQCIYLPKGANYTVECAPAEQDTAAPAGSYAETWAKENNIPFVAE